MTEKGVDGQLGEKINYYIGIDGGGTKTAALLFNSEGKIIRKTIESGTNLNSVEIDQVAKRMESLFSRLCSPLHLQEICGLFAGLAGADHPKTINTYKRIIRQVCPLTIRQLIVGNDAMNAFWSGNEADNGIVVIAGTGSIAYGMKDNHEYFRIGGWGYLFGDEGSGYYIGKEAVRRTLMAYDGRLPATKLTMILKNYFSVDTILDIVPIVYQSTRDMIAGLAPKVSQAAERGDDLALQLVNEASNSLSQLIYYGRKRFQESVPIVLTGGVWNSSVIRQGVQRRLKNVDLIFPKVSPVYGSAVKCIKEWETAQAKKILPILKEQMDSSWSELG